MSVTAQALDSALAHALRVSADRVGADLETHLISPGAVFPRPVCLTKARLRDGIPPEVEAAAVTASTLGGIGLVGQALAPWLETGFHASGDPGGVEAAFEAMLRWLEEKPEGPERREVVWHNGHGFDLPACAVHFPRLIPRIFAALERGQFRDTMTREKLLNLAINGVVDHYFTPDGLQRNIRYGLEHLTARYLGEDRASEKGHDADGNETRGDVWRLQFATLDGRPATDYPPDAREYAIKDARDALLICRAQDGRAWEEFGRHGMQGPDGKPFDVFATEPLHVGAMFCLSLATYEGFGVDPLEVERMEVEVAKARRPEQTELLFESGILSRPEPPRPYANGAKHTGAPCNCAASTHEAGTPKMKPAEPPHLSRKRLLELVVKAWNANRLCDESSCSRFGRECASHGLPDLKRNEPSPTEIKKAAAEGREPEGSISCDGEVIADLAPFDPVLDQYDHWTTVDKLVTLEIPRLQWALREGGTIHGGFDEMKKTLRASSKKSRFYPSVNIQQIPRGFEVDEVGDDGKVIMVPALDEKKQPVLDEKGQPKLKPKKLKIEPRHAYLPRRPGWVLVSIDYSFIELCTLAQTMIRAIGHSTLAEKINKGFDPHAFLGAQLAFGLDEDFVTLCRHLGASQPDDVYKVFMKLKVGSDDEKKFFKTWRNFAKPVGLGYPGGLGPRTLVAVAKKVYGVTIKSIEQARMFREVWKAAFPEVGEYLNRYVRDKMPDPRRKDSEREKFAYFSPLGAYRSNCTFTEGANGFALQTPAAEGFKQGLWRVQRACWDESQGSCLYGCRVPAAIHDELLISIPNDQWLHERAFEAARLWIEGMRVICPDIWIKADPAAMVRWDKGAEMVLGPDERLRVWVPGQKYTMDERERLRSAA